MANKNNKIKGYEIDFTTNTLFMNYKFAEASTQYGTPEYKLLQNIKNDLPNIKIVKRAGRNTKTCNANKRMTYANMENYISGAENMARDMMKNILEYMMQPILLKKTVTWFKDLYL